jgi:hypothetical protein
MQDESPVLSDDLEQKIIEEAFATIAEKGLAVDVTYDPEQYKHDLKKMKMDETCVSLLCDEQFNLLDIAPLLRLATPELRMHYEYAQTNK